MSSDSLMHKTSWYWSLLVIVFTTSCFAQVNFIISDIPARWYWEASSDQGQTWHRDSLQVSADTPSVRVRGVCEFPGPPNTYFGGAIFDATLTGIGGSGRGDAIPLASVNRCQIQNNLPQVAVSRWGATIKIDDANDNLPPGEGPYWWGSSQSAPFRGPHVSGTPICAFEYTANLDGTQGDRRIGGIFAQEPFFGPGAWIRLFRENDFNEVFNTYVHPAEQHELILRVVPAPGVIVTAAAFAIGCVTRRRMRVTQMRCLAS